MHWPVGPMAQKGSSAAAKAPIELKPSQGTQFEAQGGPYGVCKNP